MPRSGVEAAETFGFGYSWILAQMSPGMNTPQGSLSWKSAGTNFGYSKTFDKGEHWAHEPSSCQTNLNWLVVEIPTEREILQI